jgi:serine-type D-Ala-D-Ala carboxypeptidase/endopeptidase
VRMRKNIAVYFVLLNLAVLAPRLSFASPAGYEKEIDAFVQQYFGSADVGMVVAIVDENGTRVFSAGKLGGGKERVDADTVFEIGSCTKTFTALLLCDMVRRGEVKFEDPVAKYLPESVKVPSRNGKQITLENLAAQDSGLPFNATNHTGADWGERFAAYTVPQMYEFLAGYELPQDPGADFQYSNIGMGVLGHALSQKAGRSFESLVVERICRPLGMDSTCITVTPELQPRFAQGHDEAWKPTPYYELPAMPGAGAMRSTANDLAKYVAANLGLVKSDLTPLIQQMQVIRHQDDTIQFGKTAMPWYDQATYDPSGSQLLGHGGGTGGFASFIGLDTKQRRGVVVLSNQQRIHSSCWGGGSCSRRDCKASIRSRWRRSSRSPASAWCWRWMKRTNRSCSAKLSPKRRPIRRDLRPVRFLPLMACRPSGKVSKNV